MHVQGRKGRGGLACESEGRVVEERLSVTPTAGIVSIAIGSEGSILESTTTGAPGISDAITDYIFYCTKLSWWVKD